VGHKDGVHAIHRVGDWIGSGDRPTPVPPPPDAPVDPPVEEPPVEPDEDEPDEPVGDPSPNEPGKWAAALTPGPRSRRPPALVRR
jgi:hypothetical protein